MNPREKRLLQNSLGVDIYIRQKAGRLAISFFLFKWFIHNLYTMWISRGWLESRLLAFLFTFPQYQQVIHIFSFVLFHVKQECLCLGNVSRETIGLASELWPVEWVERLLDKNEEEDWRVGLWLWWGWTWKRRDLKRYFLGRTPFLFSVSVIYFCFTWNVVFVILEVWVLNLFHVKLFCCFGSSFAGVIFKTLLEDLFFKLFHVKQKAWCKCCLVRSSSFVFHVKRFVWEIPFVSRETLPHKKNERLLV